MAHLASQNYRPVDVTSWWYEWHWNRSWRNASDRGDSEAMAELERNFVDAVVAQLRYDYDATVNWFGRDVPMIALGHTRPFFAKVAGPLFKRLVDEGVVFISLDEAASDPTYEQVGKVVSGKFSSISKSSLTPQATPSRPLRRRSAKCMRRCFCAAAGPLR